MNMTVLEFSVSGQTMTETKRSTIVRDMSRDYIRLKFHFDESWDGLIKTVYFHTADSAYPALLASDELAVPNYFTQQEEFLILMVGIHGDTAVATNVLNISLDTAGGIWMAVPDEPPTPVYQELVNLAEAAAQSAAEAAAALASSVRSVNGLTPDSTGSVEVTAHDIITQQEEWPYQGNLDGAIDEAYGLAEGAMIAANAAKSTADAAQITAENAQTTANTARTLAATAVRSVNSKTPTGGNVELRSNDIKMDAGNYEDFSEESITDVVDQLGERIDAAKSTAEAAQTTAEAAESAANAAVKRVNHKPPVLGDVEIGSNDIYMDAGNYEDYTDFTITAAVDDLGQRIDSKGGKVELVRSGDRILRNGQAMTFRGLRDLLTVHPDFVYLLDGDWAYLTTYIYGQPTDAYQYIRFSSTVIGDLRAKTSSIVVQTTDGGSTYTVTSSTINSENVSNKSNTMAVLNDTRYPTTRAVADYVAAQLAAIPFAEGVTFGG